MPRRRSNPVRCPICRHLVLPLDKDGCWVEGVVEESPCCHYLGFGDDEYESVLQPGCEVLDDVRRALSDYIEDSDGDLRPLVEGLRSVLPRAERLVDTAERAGGVLWLDWVRFLRGVRWCTRRWDGGGIGSNGVCYYLFAAPEAKQRLIAMLTEGRAVLAQLRSSADDK